MIVLLTSVLHSTLTEYNFSEAFIKQCSLHDYSNTEVITQNDTQDLITFNLLYNIISYYNRTE